MLMIFLTGILVCILLPGEWRVYLQRPLEALSPPQIQQRYQVNQGDQEVYRYY